MQDQKKRKGPTEIGVDEFDDFTFIATFYSPNGTVKFYGGNSLSYLKRWIRENTRHISVWLSRSDCAHIHIDKQTLMDEVVYRPRRY